uniref:Uncharacterized protein n=1 Tax=Zea mays TaxID=4577 RepID=B6U4Y9_MAIZE|nr:hypothetical protein [Zea mays]
MFRFVLIIKCYSSENLWHIINGEEMWHVHIWRKPCVFFFVLHLLRLV